MSYFKWCYCCQCCFIMQLLESAAPFDRLFGSSCKFENAMKRKQGPVLQSRRPSALVCEQHIIRYLRPCILNSPDSHPAIWYWRIHPCAVFFFFILSDRRTTLFERVTHFLNIFFFECSVCFCYSVVCERIGSDSRAEVLFSTCNFIPAVSAALNAPNPSWIHPHI